MKSKWTKSIIIKSSGASLSLSIPNLLSSRLRLEERVAKQRVSLTKVVVEFHPRQLSKGLELLQRAHFLEVEYQQAQRVTVNLLDNLPNQLLVIQTLAS